MPTSALRRTPADEIRRGCRRSEAIDALAKSLRAGPSP